jgi:hypothetical protein
MIFFNIKHIILVPPEFKENLLDNILIMFARAFNVFQIIKDIVEIYLFL